VDAAADLSQAWHGRPAKSVTEVAEKFHVHSVLTDLGGLEEIGIADGRYEIPLRFGHDTRLCSNEAGTQLYVVGGSQKIDLKAFGLPTDKDCVVLGEAASVTYFSQKMHLGKEDKIPGSYRHVFSEESGGERPVVLYDALNCVVSFAGGVYRIDRDMDGGKFSAGIRD
jgi:hypothetical protein